MGVESASTVVGALSARSAVGLESASTVVGALSARSAVGLESASTVVCAIGARCVKRFDSSSVYTKEATASLRVSDEPLSAKILIRLLVVDVSIRILALLVRLALPLANLARVQRLLQREGIRDRRHLRERSGRRGVSNRKSVACRLWARKTKKKVQCG